MAIDIKTYLPVTSTVENILSNTKVFAGIGLSSNTLIPTTNPVLKFTSSAAVSAYFGSSSNEYLRSIKYFATSTTALAVPAYIYFGKYIVAAIAPYLRSGVVSNPVSKLVDLQAITAGDITVSVNGVAYPTTAIDLSAATSLSNAASLLTADILAANAALVTASFTITYDAVLKEFIAAIPGTGSVKTMNYFSSTTTPNLANTLGFTLATNAVLSQGADAMTAAQNLDALSLLFTDQFSISFVDSMSSTLTDAINLATATWVSAQGDKYNFMLWSNAIALESDTDTTSLWYQVTQSGLNNTSIFDEVLLNNSDRAFAAMGIFASLDLNQPNSALTLAFKTQNGLAPSVTNTNIAEILDTKKINYYGNVGISGSTVQVNWFYGGYTTGKWAYIDNLVGQIWIAFQFQVGLANLFSALPQVPNDPDGYGYIRSALTEKANGCVNNGIIATGVVFDNATVQQLKTSFGINAQELTNNGYVIVNSAASQAVRQIRESSSWFFIYVKGSAIQYLPINTVTYY